MKKTIFTFWLLSIALLATAQDWNGFYALSVDKEGYKEKLDVQIYKINGEYWGEMKATGNTSFSVEFWTVDNAGASIDCYYNKVSGSEVFPTANTHLFTLIRAKDGGLATTFGVALMEKIQHLEFHPGFAVNDAGGTIPEMASLPSSKANNANTLPKPTLSKTELLAGKWTGDVVDDFFKFMDYEFRLDGTGSRGDTPFEWSLENDNLKINLLELMSKAAYQKALAEAKEMEIADVYNVIITPEGKRLKIRVEGDRFFQIKEGQTFKVERLTESVLELSAKTPQGKVIKTTHQKK